MMGAPEKDWKKFKNPKMLKRMQSKHIDKQDKDIGAEVEHQNWLKFKRFKELEHGKEDKEKKKVEKS